MKSAWEEASQLMSLCLQIDLASWTYKLNLQIKLENWTLRFPQHVSSSAPVPQWQEHLQSIQATDQFGILRLPRCKVARLGYPANFGWLVFFWFCWFWRYSLEGHLVPELILDQLRMFRMHLIDYHVGNLGEENQEKNDFAVHLMNSNIIFSISETYLQVSVDQPVHLKIIVILSKRINQRLRNLETLICCMISILMRSDL